jgi:septum formation inhibitor MinC
MRIVSALVIASLFAGCGGGSSPEKPAEAATSTPPAATATPEATPNPQTELRALAGKYYETVAANDPAATCDTLIASERAHFERKFGKCEKAFAFSKKVRSGVEGLRAGDVTVKGDAARISIVAPSGTKVDENLYAVREDGEWGIARHDAYVKALH